MTYNSCHDCNNSSGYEAAMEDTGTTNGGDFVLPENPLEENFDTESMKGSVQAAMSRNLREFVVCEFLIGTNIIEYREGILYAVGMNYFILYEEKTRTYVLCDIYSLKFITFYQPGQRPNQGGANASGGYGIQKRNR